ncbi:MAG TPA: hypothetical protein VLB27_11265, partial [candidate division Zixibacteria bacterium]|nr:hypothetical protein [candidate division Zixibacteria bacterium]
MPAPTTIHYLVATQEFAPEVAYTARLLSLIIGCGCAFPRDCPDAPSTPCVYYGSEPRNKPPGALWIRPDRGFWSQLERDRTALPTGNVSWDKTILPHW